MRSALFGQFLLEKGLISVEQLNRGLDNQRNSNKVFGELAVEENLLTRQEVLEICEWQLSEDKGFGQVAVEMGFFSERDRDRLIELQRNRHSYLGDSLISIGALDAEALARELEEFDQQKGEAEIEGPGEIDGEVAESFLTLVVKLLPRLTRGRVISGGFYPTISEPEYNNIYSQRLGGELDLEVVLKMPDCLVDNFSQSLDEARNSAETGKARPEALLESVLKLFIASRKANMPNLAAGKSQKISHADYLALKEKASRSVCAEYFLIRPPEPSGEFLEFNVCLLFGQ